MHFDTFSNAFLKAEHICIINIHKVSLINLSSQVSKSKTIAASNRTKDVNLQSIHKPMVVEKWEKMEILVTRRQ